MKKITSIIISLILVFSMTWTASAKLETPELFSGKITWKLKDSENRTIFLIKKDNWKTDQVFSSELAKKIEWMYLNWDSVKIQWQKYHSEKSWNYVWIFVNNIWTSEEYKSLQKKLIAKKVVKLSQEEKIAIYTYLKDKQDKWISFNQALRDLNKDFWEEIDWEMIYNEVLTSLNSNILIKLYQNFSYNWDICKIRNWNILLERYNKDFQEKVKSIELNKLLEIINWNDINWENLYLFNELKNKTEIYNYLKNVQQTNDFENFNLTSLEKREIKSLSKLFLTEKSNSKEFLNKVWLIKILKNIKNDEQNLKIIEWAIKNDFIFWIWNLTWYSCNENKVDELSLEWFLENLNPNLLFKETFSKDYEKMEINWIKLEIPHNFSVQSIKLGNNKLNNIYFDNFYSSELSLNIDFVENFSKWNCEKMSEVKVWWVYWKKYKCWDRFTYRLWNENKIEISYTNSNWNFSYIFDEIIKRIVIK